MFKNKRKVDSKIRFQNPSFRKKLELARGYKRPAKILPQKDWAVFLSKIGLGSRNSRALTLLVFLLLVYLVYIPNFLFIKSLKINGAAPSDLPSIQTTVQSFLNKKTPWPQRNILLLSTANLKNYVLQNNQKVLSIDKISKNFPSVITLEVTPRIDKFIVQISSSTAFGISNDGIVTAKVIPNASGTLPSNLVLIKINNKPDLFTGQTIFTSGLAGLISATSRQLPDITKSQIDYFELDNLETRDLTVYLKNGLKILLDTSFQSQEILSKLSLVFSQFSDSDLKKLYYVDMRFTEKSYICYKNTPCVKDINLPNSATTTPAIPY